MKLSTATSWVLTTLCIALTFILGVATSTCSENGRLHATIIKQEAQHSIDVNEFTLQLSECSAETERWFQNYVFLSGKVSGLWLSSEIMGEIERLDDFRKKLEKGWVQSRRRRR